MYGTYLGEGIESRGKKYMNNELMEEINIVNLNMGSFDRWLWVGEQDGVF